LKPISEAEALPRNQTRLKDQSLRAKGREIVDFL